VKQNHVAVRLALLTATCLTVALPASGQVADDRRITIATPADVESKRKALVEFIWGAEGIPQSRLPKVEKDDVSPIAGLENLRRVDTLVIEMEAGQTGFAHHFIPRQPNNRLVIVHHGHANTFADGASLDSGYGMQRTINGLLNHGFSVLAVYMPGQVNFKTRVTGKPSSDPPMSHDQMFDKLHVEHGSVLKLFLEPVAVSLHYLQARSAEDDFPRYDDFSMTGLSGGGWTTTLYAAIDPRIRLCIPVAGTIPLYLRFDGSVGDREQTLASFYRICGYPDLYVLGSYGEGRRQIQILNRRDDCCFGEKEHDPKHASGLSFDDAVRGYERQVQKSLKSIGGSGSFQVVIDEKAAGHMISWPAFTDTILPALLQHPRSSAPEKKNGE
jgi:hypothetical protein